MGTEGKSLFRLVTRMLNVDVVNRQGLMTYAPVLAHITTHLEMYVCIHNMVKLGKRLQ